VEARFPNLAVEKEFAQAAGRLRKNARHDHRGSRSASNSPETEATLQEEVRMPSKLDQHVATIEDWLAVEPQLTALAIVCRLSGRHPEQFGMKQHSIVQRLLKALRKKAAEKLIAQEPPRPMMTTAPLPGAVDGSGCVWPDPPTAPPVEQALEVGRLNGSVHIGSSAPTAPPG
jgi:hypothetical protein